MSVDLKADYQPEAIPGNPPTGGFLWVWLDRSRKDDAPLGYVVTQAILNPHGWVDLVEVLAVFPPKDHPERQPDRVKLRNRLDASRFRVSANAWARKEAERRNLPVWTAAAGKAGA